MTFKARLDADRTAVPKTEIRAHVEPGRRIVGSHGVESYEYVDREARDGRFLALVMKMVDVLTLAEREELKTLMGRSSSRDALPSIAYAVRKYLFA